METTAPSPNRPPNRNNQTYPGVNATEAGEIPVTMRPLWYTAGGCKYWAIFFALILPR